MAFFTAQEFDYFDHYAYLTKVRQLSQLAKGDYSCLLQVLSQHFPQTANVPIRTVPFVERYVNETSGIYVRPAQRAFGATLPSDAWAKLQRVYRNSRVDNAMDQLERMAWVQQSAYLLVTPGRRFGTVKLRVLDPSELSPTISDWENASDPLAWDSVRVRVPVGGNESQVVHGEMFLSPYEAYTIKGSKKVPVFAGIENPLGRIPIVAIHTVEPDAGRWHAPAHDSLLNLALALCIQESDTELLIHNQSFGQWVLSGADIGDIVGGDGDPKNPQVPRVSFGSDKVFALPVNSNPDAPPARLEIVQGNPPIAQITGWQESRLRLFCSLKGLSADAFLRTNTAVTASARRVSEHDRKVIRDRIRPALLQAEQDLAVLVAGLLNASELVPIDLTLVEVQVTWQDPPAVVDPLHDAQATEARARIGIESPVDVIAAEQGIAPAEARRVWERNMADAQTMKGEPSIA